MDHLTLGEPGKPDKLLAAQLQGVCARLPTGEPQRAACDGMLKPAQAKA